MSSSKPAGLFIGLFASAGMLLSGCGNESQASGSDLVLQPSRDTGKAEAQFSKGFAKAYRASPNSEPKPVEKGDIAPVSLTAEPVPVD